MKRSLMLFLMIIGIVALGSGTSLADLLVDRGLPTANLNNAAGSNRSNVAWGFGDYPDYRYLAGDDFMIGSSGDYLVDTLRVWTTSSATSFWFGEAGSTFTQYTPVSSQVTYSNGENYQGSSGNYLDLYQLDISLNQVLTGGNTYQFFLDGPVPSFIHSSNAALSGSPQEGSDGLMLWAAVEISTGMLSYGDTWDSHGSGWDKSSDANIQVYGSAVPEPTTFLLFGLGILGIAGVSRKKK